MPVVEILRYFVIVEKSSAQRVSCTAESIVRAWAIFIAKSEDKDFHFRNSTRSHFQAIIKISI